MKKKKVQDHIKGLPDITKGEVEGGTNETDLTTFARVGGSWAYASRRKRAALGQESRGSKR